ncbi:c-type cytochrome [Alcaligenes endophyticus]|uniref:C-type cytochrome n=1 Tax=Alcaligenes endophyticus TaxID=1929088 RepID=A0ABT8EG52_9BURK|nr:c-type cytochrome [Alcaligenes endophyticus]MCX5590061.1 c-type cytochrome [Alcaligenes endophyticus]MDN4120276.1 c-type cytochrome [Alcaligenes endophyticus]
MSNTEQKPVENLQGRPAMIKTPQQLLVTVALAFIVPVAVIIMLAQLVSATMSSGAGSDAMSFDAIAERIQPVAGFKLVDANAVIELKTGEQVYESTCIACHGTGIAGAPKTGDKGAWEPLIQLGYDELVHAAINGIRGMPARGGNPNLDDIEVARAVAFMANQAGATFEAPTVVDEAAKEDTPKEEPAPTNDAAATTPSAGATAPVDASIDLAAGKKLYDSVCFACHATKVPGAPQFGDQAAWKPYIETGLDTMVQKAIHGVGAMPPRGGSQASDEEIKSAVQYMVDAAK